MSRNRRGTSEEGPGDAERQAADLAAFRRMLQISSGTFSLSFAICDDRKLRDSLIERFSAEFPGIAIVRLPAGVDGIYTTAAAQFGSQTPAAIFVLDIETSVPFGSDSQPALRTLNGSRELWEAFRCPVVFWLAEYAITLLHRHAPDFWRYRSHQFEFVPEAVPIAELKSESFSGFPMVDALPFEEKAFRITELERRLREAGDPPPADLLPHSLNWLYELAHLLEHSHRYAEAESWQRKALEWAESNFGANSHQSSIALNNLAESLIATNRLAEAEQLLLRVVEILENKGGEPLPGYAAALNNLAQLLQDTNRLSEAEQLMRRALSIDEANFGPDHPDVARDLNNLAHLLQATKRFADAEPSMRRALGIDEAFYGREHPSVARDLNNLASLLRATNRLEEAEPLMRRVVAIFEVSYGANHPNIATSLNNLAGLLKATNRLAEAEALYSRALGIDETSYGTDHPDVAIQLNNLARLLHDTNRLADAEPLYRRALGIFVKSFGPEHPKSQTVVENYTILLHDMKLPKSEITERVQSALREANPAQPTGSAHP